MAHFLKLRYVGLERSDCPFNISKQIIVFKTSAIIVHRMGTWENSKKKIFSTNYAMLVLSILIGQKIE